MFSKIHSIVSDRVSFCIIILFLAMIVFVLPAEIKQIDTLAQSEQEIFTHDPATTLIVFDIHGVLLTPHDIMHNLAWQNPDCFEKSDFVRHLQSDLTVLCETKHDTDYVDKLIMHVWQKADMIPIESTTIPFVNNLIKHGYKIVAITRCDVSPWGKFMPNIREWNYAKLFENGIDLSHMFDQADSVVPLTFYKGILFAGDATKNKGIILGEFLDSIATTWRPSKIICFDDKSHDLYLNSFEKEMEKRGISNICYWYNGKNKRMSFDPDVLKFQYDYLIKYHDYINEIDAHNMMNQKSVLTN